MNVMRILLVKELKNAAAILVVQCVLSLVRKRFNSLTECKKFIKHACHLLLMH